MDTRSDTSPRRLSFPSRPAPLLAYHGFGGGGMRRRRRLAEVCGGYGGGYGGGMRGGYGGGRAGGHAAATAVPATHPGYGGGGGMSYGNRGSYSGMGGGQINYGSRSGSYTTARGGTVNYGAAGAAGRDATAAGPGAAWPASRAPPQAVAATPTMGRGPGRAVGPGGNAAGYRSNVGAVSGPNGTAAWANRGYGASGYRPYGYNAYGGYHSGWMNGYWNGAGYANRAAHSLLGSLGGRAWAWLGPPRLGLRLVALRDGLHALFQPLLRRRRGRRGGARGTARPIGRRPAPVEGRRPTRRSRLFDAGRATFQQGDYTNALSQADAAARQAARMTATLHEFRALCLFALGRHDEAAAALYAVLSVRARDRTGPP
ncbi:MAG: hypothetical protein U0790_02785 [Isosphaeraceae bacterium]